MEDAFDLDTDLGEQYYQGQKELEEKLTAEIVEVARRGITARFDQGRRPAMRDAHATDNGCVRAIFRVNADLPLDLQHGVFIPGREYQAWIRFSNGSSEARSKFWPDARGMAIKLTGVDGPKLLADEKATQDFVLIS